MENTSNGQAGGIGFAGLLTIAFIVLKLTHVIGWSWWWVLSPVWIGFALFLVISIGVLVIAVIKSAKED
jgi:hypothetical protein